MELLAISLKPYSKFIVFQSRILLTLNCDVFKRTHYLSTDKIFLNISTSSNTFLLDFFSKLDAIFYNYIKYQFYPWRVMRLY